MTMSDLSIGLIGPLPPPSGGMANQTRQLARLLTSDGLDVEVVQVNAPYRPRWIGRLRGLRALFRLIPYLGQLWRLAGRADLFHIMANSGWSWHLFTAPAVWIGTLRGVPVIVNYRGGEAEAFFRKSFGWVRPTLKRAAVIIVPSAYLAEVFCRRQIDVQIVPNIIDIHKFSVSRNKPKSKQQILITRNLEPIYDIGTALHAFRRVLERFPDARLTVCGSGPELDRLQAMCNELGIGSAVVFTGTVDNDRMVDLYQSSSVMTNPSLVDNMPNSVLEALASGVPVVSTNVGGIPYLLKQGKTALLVSPGDEAGMAEAIVSILEDHDLAEKLISAGLEDVQQYTWPSVRKRLLETYRGVSANAATNGGEQDVN
jgi:glycosyltransferase involved in cell wall biosynthesis